MIYIESDNCGNYVVMQPTVDKENEKTKYCDRNICVSNEYNGIGCDECEVTKSQEFHKDMKEITEIMKCDADAETKCKMISEIVNGKPHYFKEQEPFLMREATKEESESVNNYIKSISKPTGIKFYEVLEQEPTKTGHWVRWYEIIEQEHYTILHCKCSGCNREYDPYIASSFNYCPNCGVKIVEQPQESEEV